MLISLIKPPYIVSKLHLGLSKYTQVQLVSYKMHDLSVVVHVSNSST